MADETAGYGLLRRPQAEACCLNKMDKTAVVAVIEQIAPPATPIHGTQRLYARQTTTCAPATASG
jgi:hypothetical protein